MTRTLYSRLAGMMQGGGTILWVSLLLPLLLSACTLSMEEYLVTEEKKGIEEPYTEVTPFGEFTYQYRKNVTSLNGKPQEYIAMMNDSVIWFMDNLPSKWIPKDEILSTLGACQVASGVVIPWAHHRPPLREWRLTLVCGCVPLPCPGLP